MNIVYTHLAKEDLSFWKKHNPKFVDRINQLINDIIKHPFTGLGKPEPLRFEKKGYWSRRIDREHRLVYKVFDGQLYIVQCRYHY